MEKNEILLLKTLYSLPDFEIGKYSIVEMGDLAGALETISPEEIGVMMERLAIKEYLILKYSDGEEYCLTLTNKAKLALEEAQREEEERLRQEKLREEQERRRQQEEAEQKELERRKKEEALRKKREREAEKRRIAAMEAMRQKKEEEERQKAAEEEKALEIAGTVIDLTAQSAKKGKLSFAEKKEIKLASGKGSSLFPAKWKEKRGIVVWGVCTFLSGLVSGIAGAAVLLAAVGII